MERVAPDKVLIEEDDIRRTVSANAFNAGMAYYLQGRVSGLQTSGDDLLLSHVAGSAAYRQRIRLTRRREGRLSVSGTCTCPVGGACKHVAAALLAWRDRFGGVLGDIQGQAPGAAPAPAKADPLPPDVAAWLRSLGTAQEPDTEDYPPNIRHRLLYVLEPGINPGSITVSLHSIEVRRDGSSGWATPQQLNHLLRSPQPKFLRPSDRTILNRLAAVGVGNEEFIPTLRSMVATGRGRWAAPGGPALTEADPVPGEITWTVNGTGQQRPCLSLPQPLVPLPLAQPWYADPGTGAIGPVTTGMPARLVRAMLAGPPLPPDTARHVRAEMERRWPGTSLPAPKLLDLPKTVRGPMQPHLRLIAGNLPSAVRTGSGPGQHPGPGRVPLARLSYRYGPVDVPPAQGSGQGFGHGFGQGHPRPDHLFQRNGTLYHVVRDGAAERKAADHAHALGLVPIDPWRLPLGHPNNGDLTLQDQDPAAWIDLMLADVPALREAGWLVDTADDFPLRLVEPDAGVIINIDESSGIDWFDLDLGVMVGGQRISLAPALLDYIAETEMTRTGAAGASPADDDAAPFLLKLPDGRLLTIPFEQLQPILAPLLELFEGAGFTGTGTVRLSRRNAGDLALLEAAGASWSGGEAIRALGRQLRDHRGLPRAQLPPDFAATLRPYQQGGLDWLQFLRAAGLGGILADDMGLGKTVQALAHLAVEQDSGRLDRPALVVCPTSLVPNWRAEAARFAPRLRTLVLHGPTRAERFAAIANHDLVITTYPLLTRDHAVLVRQDWHVVLLDEAQTIKNPLAATSKLARTLHARQRLCLSGTPLENHLGELWSLFDFLAPGFLGDRRSFGRRFRTPIEKAGNTARQALLAGRVAPFLLRRTKAEVAADLPAKTEIAETIDLGDAQRSLYEGIRLAMHAKVRAAIAKRGLAGSGIIILDALLKLRQTCCDPRLLRLTAAQSLKAGAAKGAGANAAGPKAGGAKAGSAKLDRLLELLPPLLEEGRRVLLFSQFTSMLALIEAELARLRQPYVLLTGKTKDRTAPVQSFQSGAVPLFLISLKAGGTGLNLTAADTVIHYDPWWNPAVENQATDRAHRIGQDKPVFVHRLITAGTIEEKMEALKQRKEALATGILGATAGNALTLTEADLDLLLGA